MIAALLTDIHGNREALEACLAHARLLGAQRLIFLGDYVGYGADPVWVVETVMDLVGQGAVALLGNHDAAVEGSDADMNSLARAAIAWTRTQLGPAHRAFLSGLPLTRAEGDALYVHANGYDPAGWDYILGPLQAARELAHTQFRLTFCGHVHVPMLYRMSAPGTVAEFEPTPGMDVPLEPSRLWLAVIGAVGQPRDGIAAANYALFDTERRLLRYLRVPYDFMTAARKVREAGLPERLALRLEQGR
ncbi:MAG TPA: metallophosphoesterase [Microvirga sp.]|nr:metallophosphoesterase [Microvirga sp.]